jgi:hypothetical protein
MIPPQGPRWAGDPDLFQGWRRQRHVIRPADPDFQQYNGTGPALSQSQKRGDRRQQRLGTRPGITRPPDGAENVDGQHGLGRGRGIGSGLWLSGRIERGSCSPGRVSLWLLILILGTPAFLFPSAGRGAGGAEPIAVDLSPARRSMRRLSYARWSRRQWPATSAGIPNDVASRSAQRRSPAKTHLLWRQWCRPLFKVRSGRSMRIWGISTKGGSGS